MGKYDTFNSQVMQSYLNEAKIEDIYKHTVEEIIVGIGTKKSPAVFNFQFDEDVPYEKNSCIINVLGDEISVTSKRYSTNSLDKYEENLEKHGFYGGGEFVSPNHIHINSCGTLYGSFMAALLNKIRSKFYEYEYDDVVLQYTATTPSIMATNLPPLHNGLKSDINEACNIMQSILSLRIAHSEDINHLSDYELFSIKESGLINIIDKLDGCKKGLDIALINTNSNKILGGEEISNIIDEDIRRVRNSAYRILYSFHKDDVDKVINCHSSRILVPKFVLAKPKKQKKNIIA